MRHKITAVLILKHCFSHSFTQVPVLGVNLQTFPILGIIGGFLYSTYNYFYVILNGGVGKNGSTVAVSALQQCIHHRGLQSRFLDLKSIDSYCSLFLV